MRGIWEIMVGSLLKNKMIPGLCLGLIACGGFNKELALNTGYFSPETMFTGKQTGWLLVRDRNGNVKAGGRLSRTCKTSHNNSQGECTAEVKAGVAHVADIGNFRYSIVHEDNLDVSVRFEGPGLEQNGLVLGDHLVLHGTRRLDDDTTLDVETRFHKASDAVVQIELYSRWGVQVGSAITTWVKVP